MRLFFEIGHNYFHFLLNKLIVGFWRGLCLSFDIVKYLRIEIDKVIIIRMYLLWSGNIR